MSQPLLVVAVSLVVPGRLVAGGLMLYEVATDSLGLVNAGAAARAQGASTLASNVAGLAWLPDTQINFGAQVLHGNLVFEADESSTVAGTGGGNAMERAPEGSLFAPQELGAGWSVGFASYGDFGLSLDHQNNREGRYFLQNGEILGMSLMPALAYRFNEQWFFGLGVRVFYADLDSRLAVDNDPFGLLERPDGQLYYRDRDHDWGYGANLGAIYSPQPATRLGLSYTSEVGIELKDGLDLQGVGPAITALLRERGLLDTDTCQDMRIPQTLPFSLYHQLDPRWVLLASLNWQGWSRFGEVFVELDAVRPCSAELNADYRYTWHLSFGSQYRFAPRWLWSVGIGYDSSPVSDADRSLAIPMAESWRFGTGLSLQPGRQHRAEPELRTSLARRHDRPSNRSACLREI